MIIQRRIIFSRKKMVECWIMLNKSDQTQTVKNKRNEKYYEAANKRMEFGMKNNNELKNILKCGFVFVEK